MAGDAAALFHPVEHILPFSMVENKNDIAGISYKHDNSA